MSYKEEFLRDFYPDPEQPFPPEEFAARLSRIRARMAGDGIDLRSCKARKGSTTSPVTSASGTRPRAPSNGRPPAAWPSMWTTTASSSSIPSARS